MAKQTVIGLLLAALCAVGGFAQEQGEANGLVNVGYRVLETEHVIDGQKMPMMTALWYPTDASPKEHIYSDFKKVKGSVAVDAPLKAGPWPLAFFSHGFSGGGIGSIEMTEALAASGYIVAAPDHHDAVMSVRIRGAPEGNLITALQHLKEKPFTEENYRYRPLEVHAVLNNLLERKDLNIDMGKVVLMGHSMGGWSVMKVALEDARVKAVVLFSMGELNWLFGKKKYFEAEQLASLKIPSVYFYGSKEADQNNNGAYAKFCYEHSPAPTYLVEIPNGNHFVYNSKAVAQLSGGTPRQFEDINETVRAFLDRHLFNRATKIKALEEKREK